MGKDPVWGAESCTRSLWAISKTCGNGTEDGTGKVSPSPVRLDTGRPIKTGGRQAAPSHPRICTPTVSLMTEFPFSPRGGEGARGRGVTPRLQLLHLDPAAAQGVDHGLGAVVHRQLAENRGDVILDGLVGDLQSPGDLFVAVAAGDVVEHFDLTI